MTENTLGCRLQKTRDYKFKAERSWRHKPKTKNHKKCCFWILVFRFLLVVVVQKPKIAKFAFLDEGSRSGKPKIKNL